MKSVATLQIHYTTPPISTGEANDRSTQGDDHLNPPNAADSPHSYGKLACVGEAGDYDNHYYDSYEKDGYTAWDGRHYDGQPPSGWFLAADNRWWPTPDLIEGDDIHPGMVEQTETVDAPIDSPTQDADQSPPQRQSPPPRQTPTRQPPPAGWAPIPSNQAEAADGSRVTTPPPGAETSAGRSPAGQSRGPGTQTRRRTGRGRRLPIGGILFFLFLINQAGGLNLGDRIFGSGEDPVVTVDIDDFLPVELETVAITGTSCEDGNPSGEILNDGVLPARYIVRVEVTSVGGEREILESSQTERLQPNEEGLWSTGEPVGIGPQTCEITEVLARFEP